MEGRAGADGFDNGGAELRFGVGRVSVSVGTWVRWGGGGGVGTEGTEGGVGSGGKEAGSKMTSKVGDGLVVRGWER